MIDVQQSLSCLPTGLLLIRTQYGRIHNNLKTAHHDHQLSKPDCGHENSIGRNYDHWPSKGIDSIAAAHSHHTNHISADHCDWDTEGPNLSFHKHDLRKRKRNNFDHNSYFNRNSKPNQKCGST
jgi:hypothetical protein